MNDLANECSKEGRRIEEDSLLSAKAHFEAAALWGQFHLWLGIPTTVIAAIAGISALKDYPTLAGLLAMGVAALSALSTFLNPSGRQSAHLLAGNQYLALRNNARIFCSINLALSGDDTRAQLIELSDRRNELNAGSPQVSRWAFTRAREGIAAGEAEYRIDGAPKA